jgi:iron complex outermembrane receptor protein
MTLLGGRVDSHQQLLDPEVAQLINKNDGGPFVGNDLADRLAAYDAPSGQVYGRTPPELPSFAANIGVSQAMHFDDGGILTSHLKYSIRDSYYFRVYDNPATDVVPELRQWDLDFKYQFGAQKVHVDFLVKNLANTASVLSRYTDNFGVGAVSNFYVAPRLFILRLGAAF